MRVVEDSRPLPVCVLPPLSASAWAEDSRPLAVRRATSTFGVCVGGRFTSVGRPTCGGHGAACGIERPRLSQVVVRSEFVCHLPRSVWNVALRYQQGFNYLRSYGSHVYEYHQAVPSPIHEYLLITIQGITALLPPRCNIRTK